MLTYQQVQIPLAPLTKWVHIIEIAIIQWDQRWFSAMPMKLTTTIGKVQTIPNSKNVEIVNNFLDYMRKSGSSEHHQNNNLKVVIAFANFLGKDSSFYDIKRKEQVFAFLDTKIKSNEEDPDGNPAAFKIGISEN